MNKIINILKNQYVLSIVTKCCNLLIAIIVSAITARYLGTTLKGQVAYISNITSITSIVLSLGVYQAYPFYKKKMSGEEFVKFKDSFVSAISIFMVIQCIITIIAISFTYMISIEVFIVVLINPVLVYYKIISYCMLVERPNKKNLVEFYVNIFEVFYMLFLTFFIKKNLIVGVSTIIIKDAILSFIYSKQFGFKFHIDKDALKVLGKLSKFGIFPMFSVLMTTLNYRVDTIMLKYYVDYSSIGVYSVGVSIAEKVWVIPDAMRDIMTSKLASGKKADEVAMVIRFCTSICIVIFIVMLLFSEPVINLLYGEEYNGAYLVIIIMLVGTIAMTYFKMIASYFIVVNKQKISFVFLTISVVVNVIGNMIMIPMLGIYGAAWTSAISYLICSILFLGYFLRTENVKLKDCLIITRKDIRNIYEAFKR